jgi:NAD(P)-dependent dehydrogenase (short-subunit alcohol dehydrogenase family)
MQKCAIVTGSSSGLGLAMTASLLEMGYTVFGGSRSGTEIEHDQFYDVELDVTSEESVIEFYETIKDFTDGIHLLINNAGICEMSSIEEMSSDQFQDSLLTNTVGLFHIFKYFTPFIVKKETHVVSILSTAAQYGYPNVSAYNASKFGAQGFLQSIKKEWKDHQMRFTNLYPGAIDTPLWDKMGASFSREKMLSVDDFMNVFDFVVNAPTSIQFPEMTFLHREGYLE